MSNRRLARRIRLACRVKLRAGEMTDDQARRVVAGSHDHETVALWKATLEKPQYEAPWINSDNPPGVWTGLDWSRLWDWLIDNWPMILKVLLSLLVFLDAPKDAK
jgi:hypothetical protein